MIDLDDFPITLDTTEEDLLAMAERVIQMLKVEHEMDPGPRMRGILDGDHTRRDVLWLAVVSLVLIKAQAELSDLEDEEINEVIIG